MKIPQTPSPLDDLIAHSLEPVLAAAMRALPLEYLQQRLSYLHSQRRAAHAHDRQCEGVQTCAEAVNLSMPVEVRGLLQ